MQAVQLYAEFLLNIRQQTIYASLQSPQDENTRFQLSSDNATITLSHDNVSASVRLPTKVTNPGSQLRVPSVPTQELTFRLQLESTDAPQASNTLAGDDEVPWDAKTLEAATEVSCRHCNKCFIPAWSIREWKDLPSENWAEMMDFWHCHKPSDHDYEHGEEDDHHSSSKGYAASNRLVAERGVGFVDLCYFLLLTTDVASVEVVQGLGSAKEQRSQDIQCSDCKAVLGVYDARANGYRIYKWSVAVRQDENDTSRQYPVQAFISAQLLALIDNQAVRRFVIHNKEVGETGSALLLWVFNADLYYSSSLVSSGPKRAMKVFYKTLPNPQEVLEKKIVSLDEVCLPRNVFDDLRSTLDGSNTILPKSAKTFQDWSVGLLERFAGES
ncbi:MAG: hypothetical protein M1827_006949 [Pycnora praestabilis]|nr:MAG: hypothetical protein M1827_006949 [Pycnora praestabilis]